MMAMGMSSNVPTASWSGGPVPGKIDFGAAMPLPKQGGGAPGGASAPISGYGMQQRGWGSAPTGGSR